VTLLLLLGVWLVAVEGGDVLLQLSQAGLAGAGMFLITLLATELAQRLAGEERMARSSLELARQQTLLNRLVIEEMTDGVLVVDRQGSLRAINPAARLLLGAAGQALKLPSPLADQPSLDTLRLALDQAYRQGSWPASAREVGLALDDGDDRRLQVRARFTRRGGIAADDTPPEDICVLFLEDMRSVQARARQDKLAAMGRMSAGIAHEIRNPLAAIAQANALLLEDALPPTQRQLARIVGDNARRLKRIVDDVLDVAPGTVSDPVVIDAAAEVAQVCSDWRGAAAPEARAAERLVCALPSAALPVLFDPEHLRRVLINLLDNAARHASPLPGAMQLTLTPGPQPGAAQLTLASDGAVIAADVERHLFEPFFSTRSRGSGLGLYICRELCERHGASIAFGLAPPALRHRNVFSVTLRAAPPA
jgi:two-component system sensor histidine kinase PilS (NtrC family)